MVYYIAGRDSCIIGLCLISDLNALHSLKGRFARRLGAAIPWRDVNNQKSELPEGLEKA